jgi:parallel beta helix pectate lyase-like protein
MKTGIAILLFVLLLCRSVSAATIFVDKDNSCNGAGTTGDPYCSIQLGLTNATAGDTVRIRDSAAPYDENAVMTVSGSSGSRIIIEPDVGHNPTLRYTGNSAQTGVIELRKNSYVTIQNLNFNGSGVHTSGFAVYLRATLDVGDGADMNGIQILNNTFQNWGGSEANASSSSVVRAALGIDGGFCNPCPGRPIGTTVTGNTFTSNRSINIFIQHANTTLVQNNTITGTKCGLTVDGSPDQIGIGIWDATDGGSTGTIIRGNTIRDWDPKSNCGITQAGYGSMPGIWCDVGPSNGLVEKNLIYNINQPLDADRGSYESQGIFIEAGCTGWKVQNNVIHNIGGAGIRQRQARGTGVTANEYYHNTIYKIGFNGFEVGDVGGNDGNVLIFKNNIIQDAQNAQISFDDSTPGTYTVDFNLYYDSTGSDIGQFGGSVLNFTNWKAACSCDANSKNADPKFVGPLP